MPRARKIPLVPYQVKTVLIYRDKKTGRFAKKRGRRKPEPIEVIRDRRGRIGVVRALSVPDAVKFTMPNYAGDPERQGDLGRALSRHGLLSLSKLKDAAMVEISVKGKTKDGKTVRLKHLVDMARYRKKPGGMLRELIYTLHNAGYRPYYKMEVIKGKPTFESKKLIRSRKPLTDLEIGIIYHRRPTEADLAKVLEHGVETPKRPGSVRPLRAKNPTPKTQRAESVRRMPVRGGQKQRGGKK